MSGSEHVTDLQEIWVIAWFPPDAPQKERTFRSEAAALKFAQRDGVIEWCPSLTLRTTTVKERSIVGLIERSEPTGADS